MANAHPLYFLINLGWIAVAAFIFLLLLFVTAPYGRHTREGWGPAVRARWGWILMEAASPVAFGLFFLAGNDTLNLLTGLFCTLWMLHYINRAVLYPLRMRDGERPMVLAVALMGFFFNFVNGYLNGSYLNLFGDRYTLDWFLTLRFIFGLAIFFAGMTVNIRSDGVLRRIRECDEDDGYRIPRGGLFRYVSCPNYLGEIVEWSGWAVLTWSLPGLTFAVWTAANLIPRALAHHRWYQERFPDYPEQRRAVLPYLL